MEAPFLVLLGPVGLHGIDGRPDLEFRAATKTLGLEECPA